MLFNSLIGAIAVQIEDLICYNFFYDLLAFLSNNDHYLKQLQQLIAATIALN